MWYIYIYVYIYFNKCNACYLQELLEYLKGLLGELREKG